MKIFGGNNVYFAVFLGGLLCWVTVLSFLFLSNGGALVC